MGHNNQRRMHMISAMVFIHRFVYDIKEQLSQSREQISTKRRFIAKEQAVFDLKVTSKCIGETSSNVKHPTNIRYRKCNIFSGKQ